MTGIRLKFAKGNEVKYISHLDLMRVFQRAIRRAEIPVSYSSGFNPHQEISFGAPLSLGVVSEAEYIDIRLEGEMDVQEVIKRLNSSLPEGIRVISGIRLGDGYKSAMSLVTHAKYHIRMNIENVSYEDLKNRIEGFVSQERIMVMKKQPKKDFELKETDIKPMIVDVKLVEEDKGPEFSIRCLLLSGSRGNLKPELLIKAFMEYTGYNIDGIRIKREEVYAMKNGRLVDLLEYES